jgi:RNA polymerase sigma factor (sigma-70 family)
MTVICRRPAHQGARATAPSYVFHPSFEEPGAEARYGPAGDPPAPASAPYMPDEVTRDTARRMHYAAHRWHQAGGRPGPWPRRYHALRNAASAGNLKLVYRAVERQGPPPGRADDLVSEGHLVLIRAVASFDPWLGVRFSTYAFTCLMRALVRLARRQAADRLAHSLLLDGLGEREPEDRGGGPGASVQEVQEFLDAGHPLLSPREKLVLARRFPLGGAAAPATLVQVGREVGLSKERVRQLQGSALDKLRRALRPAPCLC